MWIVQGLCFHASSGSSWSVIRRFPRGVGILPRGALCFGRNVERGDMKFPGTGGVGTKEQTEARARRGLRAAPTAGVTESEITATFQLAAPEAVHAEVPNRLTASAVPDASLQKGGGAYAGRVPAQRPYLGCQGVLTAPCSVHYRNQQCRYSPTRDRGSDRCHLCAQSPGQSLRLLPRPSPKGALRRTKSTFCFYIQERKTRVLASSQVPSLEQVNSLVDRTSHHSRARSDNHAHTDTASLPWGRCCWKSAGQPCCPARSQPIRDSRTAADSCQSANASPL